MCQDILEKLGVFRPVNQFGYIRANQRTRYKRIPVAVNEGHTSRRSGVTHKALETVPPPAILSASLTWSDCPSACFTLSVCLFHICPSACFTLSVCLFHICPSACFTLSVCLFHICPSACFTFLRLPPPVRLAVSLCQSVRQFYLSVCPTCPCDPGLPVRLSDLSL